MKGKLVAQLSPTLCDSMDCSLSCSSVHGILQARVLEWVAISFSNERKEKRQLCWERCGSQGFHESHSPEQVTCVSVPSVTYRQLPFLLKCIMFTHI